MEMDSCELENLLSIGPAMLRDPELLKIRSARQLARQDATELKAVPLPPPRRANGGGGAASEKEAENK